MLFYRFEHKLHTGNVHQARQIVFTSPVTNMCSHAVHYFYNFLKVC